MEGPDDGPPLGLAFSSFYFWLCWVFAVVHGLSLVVMGGGYSLVAACGLLIAVASLVAETRL